jgi:hypothetical protein
MGAGADFALFGSHMGVRFPQTLDRFMTSGEGLGGTWTDAPDI